MKRLRYIRYASLFAFLLLVAACTAQPTILPSRDFDRPTDIAFVCMGAFGPTESSADGGASDDAAATPPVSGPVVSGRPMRYCHPRNAQDTPSDQTHHTFAFLPNSSSGQLAVVDADTWALVDLDLGNAGFNQAPLGVLPSQIVASDDGCRLVTANHGSCDLSLVDPSALMTPTLAKSIDGLPKTIPRPPTTTVEPFVGAGTKLRVLPGEVALLPRDTSMMTNGADLCAPDWTWRAVVTFPSCGLVALLDLPSGRIIDSYQVTSEGGNVKMTRTRANPVCPATDCRDDGTRVDASALPEVAPTTDASDADTSDAGTADASTSDGAPASDAGASIDAVAPAVDGGVTTLLHPNPLALNPISTGVDTFRVYVGLADAPSILRFDTSLDSLGPTPLDPIPLHEGALGTNRLRLSIDPYLDKTTNGIAGSFVGSADSDKQDRKYLYAIARDGTMRVVGVANTEIECETNLDPLSFPEATRPASVNQACAPVDKTHRRPTALGPGLRFPTPAIDIAAANIGPTRDTSETSVSGAHAWVVTASGAVYLVNIDPVLRSLPYVDDVDIDLTSMPPPKAVMTTTVTTPAPTTNPVHLCKAPPTDCATETPPAPNTLRDHNVLGYDLTLDPSAGPPRVDIVPTQASLGPRIESVWTSGSTKNATALSASHLQTPIFFPDPLAATQQDWSIVWQGLLLGTPRFSGEIKGASAGGAVSLQDQGGGFCDLGMQPHDLVTIHGCVDDTQCGLGKSCVRGTNGTEGAGTLLINGLCLDSSLAPDLQKKCGNLLATVRRYDVTTARATELVLSPHLDELVLPSLQNCRAKTKATSADAGVDAADASGPDAGVDAADAGADVAGGGAATTDVATIPDSDCTTVADPSATSFECVNDPTTNIVPGHGRCLQPCTTFGRTEGCRAGRICISAEARTSSAPVDCTTHKCYCADGPDLSHDVTTPQCLDELLGYNVGVGRGFLVVGSQTGIRSTEQSVKDPNDPTNTVCGPLTMPDPRLVMRLPMDAPLCEGLMGDVVNDSRCDPDLNSSKCKTVSVSLWNNVLASTSYAPNPCLFVGGPNESDPVQNSPNHYHALFRNNEIQFMLTNLEESLSGADNIQVGVHGGFRAQIVTMPSTVELTMPARIVLGPVDSQLSTGTYSIGNEVPYLFIVDQRRLGRSAGGGPTRGQLLRIQPRGLAVTAPAVGAQPWFEDLTNSANLFPIQ